MFLICPVCFLHFPNPGQAPGYIVGATTPATVKLDARQSIIGKYKEGFVVGDGIAVDIVGERYGIAKRQGNEILYRQQ